jgi:hypothetical protein
MANEHRINDGLHLLFAAILGVQLALAFICWAEGMTPIAVALALSTPLAFYQIWRRRP